VIVGNLSLDRVKHYHLHEKYLCKQMMTTTTPVYKKITFLP